MTEEEIRITLDSLYAYDAGGVATENHGDALRHRVFSAIEELTVDETARRLWMSRLVRDMWLNEDALLHGYGIEDAFEFTIWLAKQMNARSVSLNK